MGAFIAHFLLGTCENIYWNSITGDICLKHDFLKFCAQGHVLSLDAPAFNYLFCWQGELVIIGKFV